MGPYAWETHRAFGEELKENEHHQPSSDSSETRGGTLDRSIGDKSRSPCHRPRQSLPISYLQNEDLMKLNRTREVFERMDQEAHMSYKLPKPGATAGRILAHATSEFGVLYEKQSPMTFKFGITHNPIFRWYHRPYGYKYGVEKFEHMLIVYAASNPIAPAFLEASMIQQFGSCPAFHRA